MAALIDDFKTDAAVGQIKEWLKKSFTLGYETAAYECFGSNRR